MDDKHYAEQIRSYLPGTVKGLFKREVAELCPFVQKMIADCTPGSPAYEKNHAELETYYKSISTPSPSNPTPAYELYSGVGRATKFSFSNWGMKPDASDITDFFLSFARGAQFVADEYGTDIPIKQVLVVQPAMYERIRGRKSRFPAENGICYIPQYSIDQGPEPPPDIKALNLGDTLLINAAFIYDSKVRWANRIATRHEDSLEASRALGFLKQEDVMTCAGIEECDHAYWLANPERFQEHFGMSMDEYMTSKRPGMPTNYNEDPLEKNATAMKIKAKEILKFSQMQIS